MQIKVLALTLLAFVFTLCAAAPDAHYDDKHYGKHYDKYSIKKYCSWHGHGPYCEGYCPKGTHKVTTGYGSCHKGKPCKKGERWFCCKDHFKLKNCDWYGTGPHCDGKCPYGKYKITKDIGKDKECHKGCKVYCCDKPHYKPKKHDDDDKKY